MNLNQSFFIYSIVILIAIVSVKAQEQNVGCKLDKSSDHEKELLKRLQPLIGKR